MNNNLLPLKPEIKSSVAISLENLTTRYLDINKELFYPHLFKKIDYSSYIEELKEINENLILEENRIKILISDAKVTIIERDVIFLKSSLYYTNALKEAVTFLQLIIEKLNKKVLGDETYSFSNYQNEIASFQKLDREVANLYDKMALNY